MLSPRAQQALFTLPAIRGLGEDEREQIAGLVQEVLLDKGRIVYRAGDDADALYLLVAGAVDVLDGENTIARYLSGTTLIQRLSLRPPFCAASLRKESNPAANIR